MGKRLHVATKYEVSYDNDHEDFNWLVEETQVLLNTLGCEIISSNEDFFDDEFEVEKRDFENAIKRLEEYDPDNDEGEEDITDALIPFLTKDYTIAGLIKSFKIYLDKSDNNNQYLHFYFF